MNVSDDSVVQHQNNPFTIHMKNQNNEMTAADIQAAVGLVNTPNATTVKLFNGMHSADLELESAQDGWQAAFTKLTDGDCPEYTRGDDKFGGTAWTSVDLTYVMLAMRGIDYNNYVDKKRKVKKGEAKRCGMVRQGDSVARRVQRGFAKPKQTSTGGGEVTLQELFEMRKAAQKKLDNIQERIEEKLMLNAA